MIILPSDAKNYINKRVSSIARKDFFKIANANFLKVKEQMIQEFLNHPVTIEIKAGPNSENSSGLLGGKGNLFSFIGFEEGDDPIAPILDLLNAVDIRDASALPGGRLFVVNLPSPQQIFGVTPMPWATGRSWAKGIESGISGLGFYLLKKTKASRSGSALQASVKLDSIRFKNTQYISALINKYSKEFNKIQ